MQKRCDGFGNHKNLRLLNHEILFDRTSKVLNIANPEIQRGITKRCVDAGVKVLFIDNLSTADWQDEQASNLRQGVAKYDADTHAANPYVRGFTNETERGKFEKEHADLVETCKREAVPVSFPTGKDFNLTVQKSDC